MGATMGVGRWFPFLYSDAGKTITMKSFEMNDGAWGMAFAMALCQRAGVDIHQMDFDYYQGPLLSVSQMRKLCDSVGRLEGEDAPMLAMDSLRFDRRARALSARQTELDEAVGEAETEARETAEAAALAAATLVEAKAAAAEGVE
jgi:hypothetical protein